MFFLAGHSGIEVRLSCLELGECLVMVLKPKRLFCRFFRDQPTIPGKQEEGDCWVSGGAVTSTSPWASSYLDSPLPLCSPQRVLEALFTE